MACPLDRYTVFEKQYNSGVELMRGRALRRRGSAGRGGKAVGKTKSQSAGDWQPANSSRYLRRASESLGAKPRQRS